MSSFDIDLSAIKSLGIYIYFYLSYSLLSIMYLNIYLFLELTAYQAKISDFSAFVNLEYLSISCIKLYQWPFKNLQKLIKLKIASCDLSEFDFDSLNSLTSLQIIDINTDISDAFKIDLSRLINLKWINLSFNNKEVEKTFELITDDSYNQLTKVVLNNKTIDFSKQLCLPVLKCLDISDVDLSEKINNQSFNGMSNLMKLILKNTNLTNVDFIDTDRLGNLEILDLSYNHITVLRKGIFYKLKKLKELCLRSNQIKELVPGVFEGLECLKFLDIIFNNFNIESIDKKVFDGLNLYLIHYEI